jgi:hypothetical protein
MTYAYSTAALVRAELRATQDFSSSTYPTADQLATWISEESDQINNIAGRVFGSTAFSETIDYDGEELITLKNAPVISVTSVLYSTSALGSDTYSLSDTKVADEDYTVYSEDGELALLNWEPSVGRKRIQINYTAGYSIIPPRVQMLATKRVTKRIIDSLLEKDINEKQSGKSVSVGSISIVKPADFGVSQYKTITADIDKLTQEILNGTTAYRIGGHRY